MLHYRFIDNLRYRAGLITPDLTPGLSQKEGNVILNIILGIIGAFFGAAILNEEGILFGFVSGCFLGMVVNLRRRVKALEHLF